ncbi:MAG TPA: alcohol dehydrogenase catalytic domain-containing protein [archaeon]|nr:alcohol dehydrogenase catalytic domain-containing protein [archaeon]
MKAALTVDTREIVYKDAPEPDCGPGQVLIAVRYTGICGSDIHVYRGEFSGRVSFPVIQGHEFAGVVVEKGREVRSLKVGDRVCVDPIISCRRCPACLSGAYNACRNLKLLGIDLNGGFAQLALADEEQCFKVPENVSDRDAALAELFSIGMHAATMSRINPGDKVVVLGAGRVGLAVLSNLVLTACEKVAAVDLSWEKLRIAQGLGAHATINSSEMDAVEAVAEFTGGQGADCVIECVGEADLNVVGGLAPISQAVEMIRNAGRITVLGQGPGLYGVRWKNFVWKEAAIQASRVSRGEFPRVLALMAQGRFKTGLLVSGEYPLAKTAEAFRLCDREPPDVVKIMVKTS